MKTRAAVLRRMGVEPPDAETKPLSIETVELDPPGRDEVLVRIGAAGLCHSDLSVINCDRPRPLPMALGHEAAGVVEELVREERGFHSTVALRGCRSGLEATAAAASRPSRSARSLASQARSRRRL
jgi:D-arabinose 1-dehydrogenase-like Zn-dependent alcohol dehydrogenase